MTDDDLTFICTISKFDPNRGVGTIILANRKSVSFDRNQCKTYRQLKPGQKVTVVLNEDGTIKSLMPVQRP